MLACMCVCQQTLSTIAVGKLLRWLRLSVLGWAEEAKRSESNPVLCQNSALWCLRCLLLVMCTYSFAKKALTLHLARGEGRERYFGCNLMQRKVLASSHQHLIAEASQKGRVLAQDATGLD